MWALSGATVGRLITTLNLLLGHHLKAREIGDAKSRRHRDVRPGAVGNSFLTTSSPQGTPRSVAGHLASAQRILSDASRGATRHGCGP